MFITASSNWQATQASGQERLLIDMWLELVSDDATALYWPTLCSTLQLLRNLRQTLEDIDRGVLKEYTAEDSAEELLVSLECCDWLSTSYPTDVEFLRERLQRLRDSHDGTDDDNKSHQTTQHVTRLSVGSLLRAFIDKVERDGPIPRQVRYLCDLATAKKRHGSKTPVFGSHLGSQRGHGAVSWGSGWTPAPVEIELGPMSTPLRTRGCSLARVTGRGPSRR
jgi:hypothetical protein